MFLKKTLEVKDNWQNCFVLGDCSNFYCEFKQLPVFEIEQSKESFKMPVSDGSLVLFTCSTLLPVKGTDWLKCQRKMNLK